MVIEEPIIYKKQLAVLDDIRHTSCGNVMAKRRNSKSANVYTKLIKNHLRLDRIRTKAEVVGWN